MNSEKSADMPAQDQGEASGALLPADGNLMISPEAEKELEEQLRHIMPEIGAPQMRGVMAVVEQTFSRESHSGPLPPPSQLAAYNEIGDDFAERIFRMPEREQEHRHKMERRFVNADIGSHFFALFLAFFVSVLLMAGAYYTENSWVAAAFLATSAVGMISAFIKGSRMGVFGGDGGKKAEAPPGEPLRNQQKLPPKGGTPPKGKGGGKARRN